MKKIYQENRVAFLLIAILLVSVVLIVVFSLKYFYFGNGATVYGDRLEGIEAYEITEDKQNEVIAKIKEDEKVKDCTIYVQGWNVYINITFDVGVTLTDAESKALTTLDEFSSEQNEKYDFQFILSEPSTEDNTGFNIGGAKNTGGTNLVWTNNTPVEEENKDEEK